MIQEIFLNLPYFNFKNTTRYGYDSKGNAVTLSDFLQKLIQIISTTITRFKN